MHIQIYASYIHIYIYVTSPKLRTICLWPLGMSPFKKGGDGQVIFSIQDVPQRFLGFSMPWTYRILIEMFNPHSEIQSPYCNTRCYTTKKHSKQIQINTIYKYEFEKKNIKVLGDKVFWSSFYWNICLFKVHMEAHHGSSRYPLVSRLVVDVHSVETYTFQGTTTSHQTGRGKLFFKVTFDGIC